MIKLFSIVISVMALLFSACEPNAPAQRPVAPAFLYQSVL